MGSFLSLRSNSNEDGKGCYRPKAREVEVMRKIWTTVDNDPFHYGAVFSSILSRNHPQYVKFFREDAIPEFAKDARMKKRFTAICSTISGLFVNYSTKINQRDHLLEYIAMIHKDMRLSTHDLQNFMMDILEMLGQECPKDMNAERKDLIIRYFGGLLKRIDHFMKVLRENDVYILEFTVSQKRNCSCASCCGRPMIFGRSPEFWVAKKEYWQHRHEVWASVQTRDPMRTSFSTTVDYIDGKVEPLEHFKDDFGEGTSKLVNKDGQQLPKTANYTKTVSTSSESTGYDIRKSTESPSSAESKSRPSVWYRRCNKDRRQYKRNSTFSNKSKPMEAIPEVRSRISVNPDIPLHRKSSVKSTRAFRNAVNALKRENLRSEPENTSSGSVTRSKTVIDTPRVKKRGRDTKFNARRRSSAGLMLQAMDLGTRITTQAEKFAEALAKRNKCVDS